jgi:hypothetical protein
MRMWASRASRPLAQEDSWYSFLSRPHGHSVVGRIRSTEKSNDLIRNWTRDLPVCSIVPQPCYHVPPERTQWSWNVKSKWFSHNITEVKVANLNWITKNTIIYWSQIWVVNKGLWVNMQSVIHLLLWDNIHFKKYRFQISFAKRCNLKRENIGFLYLEV